MVVYGTYYALALIAAAAIVTYLASWPLAAPFYILAAFCLYFFRDPERAIPPGAVAVSPADGKVVAVRPHESGGNRVSIFLNIFDVHVNRAPIAGEVRRIVYRAGKFVNADLDKASEDNERNSLLLRTSAGPVAVVQIAGLLARRIVCFVREGTNVAVGERIGLIRFGSRVDVYLPGGVKPLVSEGQTALAGETVIADLSAQSRALTFRAD